MSRTNRSKSRDPSQYLQQNLQQECPGGICDKVTTMGASALQGIGKGIGNAFQSIKSRVYPLPPKPAVLPPPKPLTDKEKGLLNHALVHNFFDRGRRDVTDPTNTRRIVEKPSIPLAKKIYAALDIAHQHDAGPIDLTDYLLIKMTLNDDLKEIDGYTPDDKNAIKKAIEIIDYKINEIKKKTNGGKSKRSKKHSKKHSKQSKRKGHKGHKGTRKH